MSHFAPFLGTVLAPPSATSLALRGGFAGLLRGPEQVARDDRLAAYQRDAARRLALIEARQRQIAALRRAIGDGH